MQKRVDTAVSECWKIRSECLKLFKDLDHKVNRKASATDMQALDDHLSASIDQIVASFSRKYADRLEVKKRIRAIELRVRNL